MNARSRQKITPLFFDGSDSKKGRAGLTLFLQGLKVGFAHFPNPNQPGKK
jgi:hypothetical protein